MKSILIGLLLAFSLQAKQAQASVNITVWHSGPGFRIVWSSNGSGGSSYDKSYDSYDMQQAVNCGQLGTYWYGLFTLASSIANFVNTPDLLENYDQAIGFYKSSMLHRGIYANALRKYKKFEPGVSSQIEAASVLVEKQEWPTDVSKDGVLDALEKTYQNIVNAKYIVEDLGVDLCGNL